MLPLTSDQPLLMWKVTQKGKRMYHRSRSRMPSSQQQAHHAETRKRISPAWICRGCERTSLGPENWSLSRRIWSHCWCYTGEEDPPHLLGQEPLLPPLHHPQILCPAERSKRDSIHVLYQERSLSWSPSSLACLHPVLTFQWMNIISPSVSLIPIVMYLEPFSHAPSIFHSHNLFGSPSSLLTTFHPPDLSQRSVTYLSLSLSFPFLLSLSFPIDLPTTSQIIQYFQLADLWLCSMTYPPIHPSPCTLTPLLLTWL